MALETTTRRQRHATTPQRLRMVEQFRRSGLTRIAFSRQYGIPPSTLNWWLAKTKRAQALPAPLLFSEVRVDPPIGASTSGWAMEIVSRSGLIVRCREVLSVRELIRLFRG